MPVFTKPDGTNQSLDLAISPDGTPIPGVGTTIPARCGIAVRLAPGQSLTVINPSGRQVCDFWAFDAANPYEYLSMAHIHTDLSTLFRGLGTGLSAIGGGLC